MSNYCWRNKPVLQPPVESDQGGFNAFWQQI